MILQDSGKNHPNTANTFVNMTALPRKSTTPTTSHHQSVPYHSPEVINSYCMQLSIPYADLPLDCLVRCQQPWTVAIHILAPRKTSQQVGSGSNLFPITEACNQALQLHSTWPYQHNSMRASEIQSNTWSSQSLLERVVTCIVISLLS